MQAVVRALLERDRGQDVVTVCGVVRHASSPQQQHTPRLTHRDSPTALTQRDSPRRDGNGLVCGFLDGEQPASAPLIPSRPKMLSVACQ